jgi:hypothetical protein
LAIATKSNKIIEEHENTIFKMQGHARDYMDEIVDLKESLEKNKPPSNLLRRPLL